MCVSRAQSTQFSATSTLPNGQDATGSRCLVSESFARISDKLAPTKGDHLMKIPIPRRQASAVGFPSIGMNHTIHHGGQALYYLRCMRESPSNLRGSFDDAQAPQSRFKRNQRPNENKAR